MTQVMRQLFIEKKIVFIGLILLLCGILMNIGFAEESSTVESTLPVQVSPPAQSKATEQNVDFRNVCWGMPPQEVKEREASSLVKAHTKMDGAKTIITSLEYDVVVDEEKGKLTYSFTNGTLTGSSYRFIRYAATDAHYDKFKAAITLKYGNPLTLDNKAAITAKYGNSLDRDLWLSDSSNWRDGYWRGYYSEWFTPRVKIKLARSRRGAMWAQELVLEYTAVSHKLDKDL